MASKGTGSYPADLVPVVVRRWREAGRGGTTPAARLPAAGVLQRFLDICFHASLEREEGRQVTAQFFLLDSAFHGAPPAGTWVDVFVDPVPFTARHVRKLAPAVDDASAAFLVGRREGRLAILGVGRKLHREDPVAGTPSALLDGLRVHVQGPGRMSVFRRGSLLCRLAGGEIYEGEGWVKQYRPKRYLLQGVFRSVLAMHRQRMRTARVPHVDLDIHFVAAMYRDLVGRLGSALLVQGHGGLLVFVPDKAAEDILERERFVRIKYRLERPQGRARLLDLFLDAMRAAAVAFARAGKPPDFAAALASRDQDWRGSWADIGEGLRHLAALGNVDGAVVITHLWDILGFGGEVLEDAPAPRTVFQLGLSGKGGLRRTAADETGMRHRAAYRLCASLPRAMAVVASQDGSLRFVMSQLGRVRYFSHWGSLVSQA